MHKSVLIGLVACVLSISPALAPAVAFANEGHGGGAHVEAPPAVLENSPDMRQEAGGASVSDNIQPNPSHTPTGGDAQEEGATYEILVVAKQAGALLAMYNTLSAPVDGDSLRRMALYCFQEVKGKDYERVMINWYLPGQEKNNKPWAVSNFAKGAQLIEILNAEEANRFPAVKRWNQQGHKPIQ